MNHEVLGNRRRALEESFFARQNNKLLEQLRSQAAAEELQKQLSEVSGIEDSETLQQMADANIARFNLLSDGAAQGTSP